MSETECSVPIAKLQELYELLDAASRDADRSARITNVMLEKLKKHESLDAIEFVKLPSATNRTSEKLKQAFKTLSTIPPLNAEPRLVCCDTPFVISKCSGQGPSATLAALAKALHAADKKIVTPSSTPAEEDIYT